MALLWPDSTMEFGTNSVVTNPFKREAERGDPLDADDDDDDDLLGELLSAEDS